MADKPIKGMRVFAPEVTGLSTVDPEAPEPDEPGSRPLSSSWEYVAWYHGLFGWSYREIADETGRAYGTIKNIASQPLVKQRIEHFRRVRMTEAMAKINAELLPSIEAIVDVRDDRDTPAQTRLQAATTLAAMAGVTTSNKRTEVTGANGGPVELSQAGRLKILDLARSRIGKPKN
jgi:hypothetical protein